MNLDPGVSYKFAGNYEQQERATSRLMIVVPLALLIVLLVLYFQFKTVTASLIHFSGVFVAFAGGFILLWLYGQDWFMNFSIAGENMRDLFQMHTINLSVAVWYPECISHNSVCVVKSSYYSVAFSCCSHLIKARVLYKVTSKEVSCLDTVAFDIFYDCLSVKTFSYCNKETKPAWS